MPNILLTGGGTSGHVTPNMALVPELESRGFEIYYIGRQQGIERELVEEMGLRYYPITAGKLRRYIDIKNILDIGKIAKGFFQAIRVINRIKPNVVFSKGGFVSTPVVWAASLKRIPVIIHESDMTPGLANKLSVPFAKKICYAFPETQKYIDEKKAVFTGIPIRQELFKGDKNKGKEICEFLDQKPIIVVIGGSQGSKAINDAVRKDLVNILKRFQVCHICGKGGIDKLLEPVKGYKQFEYVAHEQPHLFAMADIIVSRAGATTIFEILALRKPNILIPLSKKASRGDQILNAMSFEKQGFSYVLQEEKLPLKPLNEVLIEAYSQRIKYINNMKKSEINNGIDKIISLIAESIKF